MPESGIIYLGFITFICIVLWALSVPVYSMTEKEEYRYLGRVFLKKKNHTLYLSIPKRFLNQSVTTKFLVSLPCTLNTGYSYYELHIRFCSMTQIVDAKRYVAFYLPASPFCGHL